MLIPLISLKIAFAVIMLLATVIIMQVTDHFGGIGDNNPSFLYYRLSCVILLLRKKIIGILYWNVTIIIIFLLVWKENEKTKIN